MIKVLVKREKTGKVHIPGLFDERFVRVFVDGLPMVGEGMTFWPRMEKHLDDDCWHTTVVKKVRRVGDVIEVTTKNSLYLLKTQEI